MALVVEPIPFQEVTVWATQYPWLHWHHWLRCQPSAHFLLFSCLEQLTDRLLGQQYCIFSIVTVNGMRSNVSTKLYLGFMVAFILVGSRRSASTLLGCNIDPRCRQFVHSPHSKWRHLLFPINEKTPPEERGTISWVDGGSVVEYSIAIPKIDSWQQCYKLVNKTVDECPQPTGQNCQFCQSHTGPIGIVGKGLWGDRGLGGVEQVICPRPKVLIGTMLFF
jgi:hypothetical protein